MSKKIEIINLLAMVFAIGVICSNSQAAIVVIDFDDVAQGSYSTYSEDGFTLTPNVGSVRISNLFPPYSNAAAPSFGFGQGTDSSFTFTNDNSLLFSALSVDLLEGTVFPDNYGVTLTGTKSDFSTVTQTFTLDGIAGSQTFAISSAFTELVFLKIGEDVSNQFFLDLVKVDNVMLDAIPEPTTALLLGLGGLVLLRKRRT